ncbi:hypothetical protein [Natrinema marinum]|uniref:hypothetical protein n=1 Tax=Natrinema marinum TaxID=2961598 RepID=UPI0020C91D87|nr:hypothetical protein [Natrinema marinum]
MTSRAAVVVFVVVLVGSVPAGVGALEPAPQPASPAPAASLAAAGMSSGATVTTGGGEDVLHRTTVLSHRPDDTDAFGVEMTFRVPDSVTELEITLEEEASVESTRGFERTGERTFEWTGGTASPTVRYAMPADRTGEGEQRASASGDGYTFVDTGEWGVVPVPGVGITVGRTEPVGFEETVTVDGPGATGGDIAFFGPVTTYERDANGETFRLVVPEAADLEESPDAILSALTAASGRLEVGMRSDEVFVVAVPNTVDWGPRGIQYGRSDAWVVDDAGLDEPNPVWLHEYVHVRQRFSTAEDDLAPDAAWLVEGQADYYAGLLALEGGLTDFSDFRDLLERGERSLYADGVLARPSTWEDDRTDYAKGALVAGELDRRLRLATDGDRTLEDVFRTLNAREGTITEADFLDALEDAGGNAVRAAAEKYTQTDATPSMWSRRDHEVAFDQPVAVFEYGIDSGPLEVAGQEWQRWSAAASGGESEAPDVIAVPAGESVSIPVAAANVGERDGTYDAMLQVDGRVVDHRRGTLAAGERTSHRLTWTPAKPGTYDVRVGSERLTAVVRAPSSVTVSELRVTSGAASPGESVTMTATVEAADERPGAAVLAFRTVEGTVAERPVAVRPGETTTVEAELRFDDRGRYEVVVGEATTTVSVGGPAATVEEVSGFGVPSALAAVATALAGALLARRR